VLLAIHNLDHVALDPDVVEVMHASGPPPYMPVVDVRRR
jgi:hypothetical protein